jgi:lipoprotein-anchoring transpeptidase ErfK/SrfK
MQSRSLIPGLAALALVACARPIDDNSDTTAAVGATAAQGGAVVSVPQVPAGDPAMRIEVDVAARRAYVFRKGEPGNTLSVAVGSNEWPTRTGEFQIKQVVWNPDWIPPKDEEWAKDEKPEQSGDPDNPLGQAQLVYDAPRSIHGTNEPASIGKAVSHGSIRMRNEDIVRLAREVMEAGGAQKDASFFTQVRRNRSAKEVIDLPSPVPIVIR